MSYEVSSSLARPRFQTKEDGVFIATPDLPSVTQVLRPQAAPAECDDQLFGIHCARLEGHRGPHRQGPLRW
jgi:hypothetical protein